MEYKLTLQEKLLIVKHIFSEILMEALAFIVVPIAVAFCKKDDQRLPKWASWFDEETYGINAEMYDENGKLLCEDGGHCGPNGRFPRPKNRTWYARVRWLLRNRIGVFSTKINGIKYSDINPDSIVVSGDMNVPGYSGTKGNKWGLIRAELKNGKKVFALFVNKVWGKKFYIRMYLGYKLFDISEVGLAEDKQKAMDEYLKNPDSKIYAKTVWAFHPMRVIPKVK